MGEDILSTLDAVDRLCVALGLRRYQLCMKAGDLTTAAALADDWAAGRLTADDVLARLEGEPKVDGSALPDRGSFRAEGATGNSIPVAGSGRRVQKGLSL